MGEEKLWDYDFPVNGADEVAIGFESGESSLSDQLLGSSDNQPLPDYNFTSFLEEFEREYDLAPNSSTVNDHNSFSEENAVVSDCPAIADGAAVEESPPNASTGMMDYIPTSVDQDVTMEESASYSSLVHQIASLPDEEFLEFVMNTNMVYDHVYSSNEGNNVPDIHSSDEGSNVAVEETTQTPVTPCGNAVSQEQEGGPVINSHRLTVTFDNHPIPRVLWTPELHSRFVLAVEHLGGCKCRRQTKAYFITDECRGFKPDSRGEPFTVVPQRSKLIGGQH